MFQKVTLVGNAGKDAEMRYTASGQAVTSFSLAVNRQYTQNGEKVKETMWVRVTSWGNLAETVNEYVKRGMLVLVEGRLNPDPSTGGPKIWTNNAGVPQASFEVTASEVRFLSRVETESKPSYGDDLPPEFN